MLNRRRFLASCGGLLLASNASRRPQAATFDNAPFALGVASGYPTPTGFTLWTRLAPAPYAPDGGMPNQDVLVHWDVAEDDNFSTIVASGTTLATPAWAHSVHVDVTTLRPDRWYRYRFHVGNAMSPVGRTRTAPALESEARLLRLALVSCQHYEHGYYAAYRHMLADDLDLVVHVGDYIYEGSWGNGKVRSHIGPDPTTLIGYRQRYACYKADPLLQATHAVCPWLMVWDDHEVQNDYAADHSRYGDDPVAFVARRNAAYRAYYEHMPLPEAMRPRGVQIQIYTHVPWGRLAQIALLDDRQYRSYRPCSSARVPATPDEVNCRARTAPTATMLGAAQEAWLEQTLASSTAQWNVIAQQTLMAQNDGILGPGEQFNTDGWDGYPAARGRLLATLEQHHVANPIVLGGDVHAFWVADLPRDFSMPKSPIVATEFVGTSITSYAGDDERIRTAMHEAPNIKFGTGRYRGYLRLDLRPEIATADLRALRNAQDPNTPCATLASFNVASGRPGAVRA